MGYHIRGPGTPRTAASLRPDQRCQPHGPLDLSGLVLPPPWSLRLRQTLRSKG